MPPKLCSVMATMNTDNVYNTSDDLFRAERAAAQALCDALAALGAPRCTDCNEELLRSDNRERCKPCHDEVYGEYTSTGSYRRSRS